jgi:predicted TIM-barrel fold metal-dependent hydrolase
MSRIRALLALLFVMACQDSSPSAVPRPSVSIIDIHTHLGGVETWPGSRPDFDEIAAAMRDRNVELVVDFKAPDNSLVNGVFGDRVTQRIAMYPDTSRFKLFANVPIDDAKNVFLGESRPDYPQWVAGMLEDAVRRGAVGLKIKDQAGSGDANYWTVDRAGVLIPFDTPKFDSLWSTAAQLRVPVLVHLGGAYKAEHQGPKGDKRSVRWEMLMLERERVLRKHPTLQFIGAHWGGSGDDRGYLEEMLRRYPNFLVEGGAHHDKDAFATLDSAGQRFFDEYQDQLLFGTDYMENTFRWLKSYRQRLDMFLPYTERWPLSDGVRAKYYHANARRLLHRTQGNTPPIAHPGFTTTHVVGDAVTLDGSRSWDPDGDRLRYRWRQVSGTPVALGTPDSARARFVAKTEDEYVFELTAQDASAAGPPRTVRVNVVDRAPAFAEQNGSLVIEAEHFMKSVPRFGRRWATESSYPGFSGGGYVTVGGAPAAEPLPNTFRDRAPELQYVVWIESPGTYVVHVRGSAGDSAGAGVNVGVDNEEARLADHLGPFGSAGWEWIDETGEWDPQFDLMARNLAVLNVAEPGLHIINVWMRRPGFRLDKLVLTRETRSQVAYPLTLPGSGTGPAESARIAIPIRNMGR